MLREDLSPTTKETIKQNDLEELKKGSKGHAWAFEVSPGRCG